MQKATQWVQPCKYVGTYPNNWAGYVFLQWSTHSKNWHEGVDYNGAGGGNKDRNLPILACANGVVEWVGYHKGWGWHVYIEHDHPTLGKLYSHYAHLEPNTILVKAGQEVTYGQRIAGMGASGWPDGTMFVHLHFEIRKPIGQGYDFFPTPANGWDKAKVAQYYYDPFLFIEKNKNVVDTKPQPVPSTPGTMPENNEVENLLKKYNVKTLAELSEMVDRELGFLKGEREKTKTLENEVSTWKTRHGEVSEQYNDFILEIVEILNPAKPLPAVTDRVLAVQLVQDLVSSEDKLRKELKTKEKEFAEKEAELIAKNQDLQEVVEKMEQQIEKLKEDLQRVKKDVKDQGKEIVENKQNKTFIELLKSIIFRGK